MSDSSIYYPPVDALDPAHPDFAVNKLLLINSPGFTALLVMHPALLLTQIYPPLLTQPARSLRHCRQVGCYSTLSILARTRPSP